MDEIEKIKSFLESDEGKISMNKHVEEMIEKQKRQKEIMKEMLSNTDYIEWLIDFTKDRESFADSDWDYSSEKLNDIDQKNVNNLSLFFEGVYNYARDNYLYSTMRPFGESFQLKLNDIGLEIGYMSGQGTLFYCKRIPLTDDSFIDINDVITNKKQDNVDSITSDLNYLSDTINNLYKRGVPLEAISTIINKTISEIVRYEKDNEPKVYIKK